MIADATPSFVPEPGLRAHLERLSIVSVRPHGHLHTGGRRSRATGSSIEFADHRRYSPGDDFRQIDWNLYARSDDLFIKVRESEETLVVHLLLDVSASMGTGDPTKLHTGQAVLAALGWITLTGHDVLSAAAFGPALGEVLPPLQGRAAMDRLIEFLDQQRPAGRTGLAAAARAHNARALPHGVAILVSDLLAPDAAAAIGTLAERGHELTVIHVLDREFLQPAFAEEAELVDVEGGAHVEIFGDPEILVRYRSVVTDWMGELQRFCHQRNVRYVPIESDWPVEDIVLRRLRAHRVTA